jgi:hypothetical protein
VFIHQIGFFPSTHIHPLLGTGLTSQRRGRPVPAISPGVRFPSLISSKYAKKRAVLNPQHKRVFIHQISFISSTHIHHLLGTGLTSQRRGRPVPAISPGVRFPSFISSKYAKKRAVFDTQPKSAFIYHTGSFFAPPYPPDRLLPITPQAALVIYRAFTHYAAIKSGQTLKGQSLVSAEYRLCATKRFWQQNAQPALIHQIGLFSSTHIHPLLGTGLTSQRRGRPVTTISPGVRCPSFISSKYAKRRAVLNSQHKRVFIHQIGFFPVHIFTTC